MQIDTEQRLFRLETAEDRFLRLPDGVVNPVRFDQAQQLLWAAQAAYTRAEAFDPSDIPQGTQKSAAMEQKKRLLEMTGQIVTDVTPYAESAMADAAEEFLKQA